MTGQIRQLAATYAGYMRLDGLLALQHPRTPAMDAATWASEHFFIVCHQASELWATQILIDISGAARSAEAGDWEFAVVALTRACALVDLVRQSLTSLLCMPVADFMRFRGALEGASAAESRQFAALLRCAREPAVQSLRASLATALPATAPGGKHGCGSCRHAECAAARALESLLDEVRDWRRMHAEIARHFIADLPGTGGTSGVSYLVRDDDDLGWHEGQQRDH